MWHEHSTNLQVKFRSTMWTVDMSLVIYEKNKINNIVSSGEIATNNKLTN